MRRLLIRPGAIGDCLLSLPALEHATADETEVWIPRAVVPLIDFAQVVRPLAATGIDRVAIGDEPMEARLREHFQTFDSIASWYGSNRPEFREAMESTGVPCEFHRALPPAEFAGHACDFFAQQVGAPDGLIPRIRVKSVQKRRTIVIHPFSGGRTKNWPLENYRALAQLLARPVEWVAGPEEELAEAERFEDLRELATWLAGADLYIGNDSGITHLAAASGVNTLALFGPTSPDVWGPRGENVLIVRNRPLSELPVQRVFACAEQILSD